MGLSTCLNFVIGTLALKFLGPRRNEMWVYLIGHHSIFLHYHRNNDKPPTYHKLGIEPQLGEWSH